MELNTKWSRKLSASDSLPFPRTTNAVRKSSNWGQTGNKANSLFHAYSWLHQKIEEITVHSIIFLPMLVAIMFGNLEWACRQYSVLISQWVRSCLYKRVHFVCWVFDNTAGWRYCYQQEQSAVLCMVSVDFYSVMTDCKFLVKFVHCALHIFCNKRCLFG